LGNIKLDSGEVVEVFFLIPFFFLDFFFQNPEKFEIKIFTYHYLYFKILLKNDIKKIKISKITNYIKKIIDLMKKHKIKVKIFFFNFLKI